MGYQKNRYPFGLTFPKDFRYTTIGQGLYHRLSRPPLRSGLDGLIYENWFLELYLFPSEENFRENSGIPL